ncbi:hypothetical protein KNE206_68310 [Kitasatospora sp. NE20-6]
MSGAGVTALRGGLRRLVRTAEGRDAGKKIAGRERNVATDTIGLLLAVLVTAASVQDGTAGRQLPPRLAARHPTARKAWADTGHKNAVVEHGATLGIDIKIVRRTARSCSTAASPATTKPSRPAPKPWSTSR